MQLSKICLFALCHILIETGDHPMPPPYEDRLRRVIRYIHDNPNGDLSLDALADVAALSRFHWHRVLHAMTGETCAEAVKRVRAHRASTWLVQTDLSLSDIASQAGYGNVQSFSRAFRDVFGATPTAFRKSGTPSAAPLILKAGDQMMFEVTQKEMPAQRLAMLTQAGFFSKIGRTFEQLCAVFASHALWAEARGMVAVYFDAPGTKPEADLRSVAGVRVEDSFDIPSDLQELRLKSGRHAVLRFQGPYSGLPQAYDYFYGTWFPNSGEEPGDAPPFEVYHNTPSDVAPADLLTDICVPLKNKG